FTGKGRSEFPLLSDVVLKAMSGIHSHSQEKEDSGGKSEKETELLVRCCVCSAADAYEILPVCLHSACRQCTVSLKTNGGYKCASCKEFSPTLISNPILFKSESLQKSPNCNWCHDNGEQTKSIGNCKECDAWLCGECLKGHNRMPPLRSHGITMLPKSAGQDGLHCELHPREALECFCEACDKLTCRDCQLSIHRDHGSHRWVGEKANLLTAPLEEAIRQLEQSQNKLAEASQLALTSSTSTRDDSFLGSVEKTRSAIEARASSLILRIRSRTDALLQELNAKCMESVNKLVASEGLMREIQDQIRFTLAFADRLIKNKDSDPASLVQLFKAVQARIQLLQNRAEHLWLDAPPSMDADEPTVEQTKTDYSSWRKNSLGWRDTANMRALFIANWDPDELARHSGTITWLPVQQVGSNQPGINEDTNIAKSVHGITTDKGKPDFVMSKEYGDFLDSLSIIDGRHRTSDSLTEEPVAGGVGCAICFDAGLLAHCGKCRRAYHLDCHLPRLTNICLIPGWVCGLCEDQDAATAAQVQKSDETGLSHTDYLTGCRILMALLVHAEAVHFTASVCPACSLPLLTPGRSVPHCPAGHLYHRLAELRLQLEEAASVQNGDHPKDDALEEHIMGSPQALKNTSARLTHLDDWLVEVDKFWSDAANEDNQVSEDVTTFSNKIQFCPSKGHTSDKLGFLEVEKGIKNSHHPSGIILNHNFTRFHRINCCLSSF
ncbi:E3 ubiquitin-protein ligase TRIM33, partial [Clonorchis sinensis]